MWMEDEHEEWRGTWKVESGKRKKKRVGREWCRCRLSNIGRLPNDVHCFAQAASIGASDCAVWSNTLFSFICYKLLLFTTHNRDIILQFNSIQSNGSQHRSTLVRRRVREQQIHNLMWTQRYSRRNLSIVNQLSYFSQFPRRLGCWNNFKLQRPSAETGSADLFFWR